MEKIFDDGTRHEMDDNAFEDIFYHFFADSVTQEGGMWQEGWSDFKGMKREKIVILPDKSDKLRGVRGWKNYFHVDEIPMKRL